MNKPYTIPAQSEIQWYADKTPDWMTPCSIPSAVIQEGALSPLECTRIYTAMCEVGAYPFPGCDAVTTEAVPPLDRSLFGVAIDHTLRQNAFYWKFELRNCAAWMQEYKTGGKYQRHLDSGPGHSRKMTSIIMLTPAHEYDGGELFLYTPLPQLIPKTQGTIVTFPSWTHHEVKEVVSGHRETINLGFYGPPFK